MSSSIAGRINLTARAFTQYLPFPYSAMATFKGKLYLAGTDGLYCLDRPDSTGEAEGEEMAAMVETVLHDWGVVNIKRPRFCRLGIVSDGDMLLEILDRKLNVLGSVVIPSGGASLDEGVRVPFPRTVHSRFFKFRISNIAGSSFSLKFLRATINVRPNGLSKTT